MKNITNHITRHLRGLSAIMAVALLGTGSVFANLKVEQIGDNNTLVRVDTDKRYIILPVQESKSDSKIDVLVNGNVEHTFYVRLAADSINYYVPFDVTPYTSKGTVMLNISLENGKTEKNICWKEMTTADEFDAPNVEQYRPLYHHTPLYGWMNDPNGMFYKDGRWHLYYQYNPYGSKWQNMTWGHSSSTDLVNWEHHDPVLRPDALGSIFSGSAVVDHANTAGFGNDAVIALYTAAGLNQVQSMAYSLDNGKTFTKYLGNPVIANRKEARDPNMFRHEPTGQWVLILADPLEQAMQIHTSADLKNWTLQSKFGKGYGSRFGVWECPDLFELPVKGTNQKKWVLVCNINPGAPFGGSGTQYFVGDFDGKVFTADTAPFVDKWMDYGKDHYATVSWSNAPDNRRSVIGWMSNWQYAEAVPTMQFRSANTLPRDLGLFRAPDNEIYLSVVPSPEVDAMRSPFSHTGAMKIDFVGKEVSLPTEAGCEIVLDYQLDKVNPFDIVLSNAAGDEVVMTIDPKRRTFAMDRTRSGLTNFSDNFPVKTIAPTHNNSTKGTLRIFIDRCSIEVFDGEGRFAMTNLVFPTQPYSTLAMRSRGNTRVNSVDIYTLRVHPTKDVK